jgi:PHD/YefM family antitoxin component YafN of YafNO toxin-antitoxin module
MPNTALDASSIWPEQPLTVEKHGRPVVVVLAIEEYEKLREIASGAAAPKSAGMKRLRKSGGTVNT